MNGKIVETYSSIGADLVVIKKTENLAPSLHTSEAVRLCAQILKRKMFVSCEPDRRLIMNSETVMAKPSAAKSTSEKSGQVLPAGMSSDTATEKCEVVPQAGLQDPQTGRTPGKDGTWKVSPLWAQHAIGADLASEFTLARFHSGKIQRVPIGNIDKLDTRMPTSPIDSDAARLDLLPYEKDQPPKHGSQTTDLVDKPPFGVSPVVSWSLLANLSVEDGKTDVWNSRLIKSLEVASKSKARLVTASVGFFGSAPRVAINRFVETGKIFVHSSGNDYPVPTFGGISPQGGHILVGSVGPNGLPSPFSQEPTKIYAPSDGALLSGPTENFGQTSGATPLVSGSLANALASLPGLTNEEAETILYRTSLSGFAVPTPGVVNAYRLAVVASCLGDDWPASRASLSSAEAKPHPCFDQSKTAKVKLEAANRLLFEGEECENKRDGLKLLRASYLLDPTAHKARQLAQIYKDLGFQGDARWYETRSATSGSASDQRRHFQALLKEPSLSAHRYFGGSNPAVKSRGAYAMTFASRLPESHEFVKIAQADVARLAESSRPEDQLEAIERAGFLGPHAIPFVLPALQKNRDFDNPRSAGVFFDHLCAADGGPNPWHPILREKLKGTGFEHFLREISNR